MTPSPARLDGYRRIERRRGLPLPMQALLAGAVVVLGVAILWAAGGQVGPFLSGVVRGVGGFVSKVGALAASPSPSAVPEVGDAPVIAAPEQPYTNSATADITIHVASAVAGSDGYTVRLYLSVPDGEPTMVAEEPVGETSAVVITGVRLANGRNDLQATVMGPGGESEASAVATWILDTSKPKVSVISPKNNAQVSKASVTIKGKAQAGSAIRLQNAANGAISTAKAGSDGLWRAPLTLADGGNPITITATDPAGNANAMTLNLRKGSGKLVAALSGSAYRFRASRLPRTIKLTVTVTGPDGSRLRGATALFTLTVPGLEAIVSSELTTNRSGVASFSTRIPAGATPGSGLVSVLVSAGTAGTATDRQVLTIVQ